MHICVDFLFQQARCAQHRKAGYLCTQCITRLVGGQGNVRFASGNLAVALRDGVFLGLVEDLAMALISLLNDFTGFLARCADFLPATVLAAASSLSARSDAARPSAIFSRRSSMDFNITGQMYFMQNHTKIIIAIDCKNSVALRFMP